jgi:hypothetical protein
MAPALLWLRRRWWWVAELAFAVIILGTDAHVALFFRANGYLPQPFFLGTNDTFMDWFNVAVFGHGPGAYYEYESVYPPLTFVVARLLSNPGCFRFYDAFYARSCDWTFPYVFGAAFILNAVLIFQAYARRDKRTVWPRTIAMVLGLPMLFGLERGQAAILCFTFFVIAHGGAVRWGPLRWFSNAMTINFKPYLALALAPYLIKRQWRAFELSVLFVVAIYLVTFAILGAGTPGEILKDIGGFDELPTVIKFDNMFYQTSYKGILDGLSSTFPFTYYVGSELVDKSLLVIPLLIRGGEALSVACLLAAAWRPNAVPMHRLMALAILIPMTSALVGGYAQIFILFLVFMERGDGVGRIIALAAAYALCITGDYRLMVIAHTTDDSYLSGQRVGFDIGVNLGELIRPGLVLLIQYALIAVSAADLWRARTKPSAARQAPEPPSAAEGVLHGA